MPKRKKIRYAVVGLGSIAQEAVLPAFRNAENSDLVALVSSDERKRTKLGKIYDVDLLFGYEEYEECLRRADIDAVYIALPNDLHHEYVLKAANAGIHVLCEKPMAVTARECEEMIKVCEERRVKLMIAYRLHFEAANLRAVDLVRKGKIGDPRMISALFGFKMNQMNDIRAKPERYRDNALWRWTACELHL